MNRERFAWIVSVMLIGILAFQLPGTMAQREDDYSFVRTLVDIHRQVSANYVEAVDEQKLREGAIEGMLGQLDPFTVYIPPEHQESFDNMLENSFKGVGIQLNQLEDGRVEVVTPIDGSPAFKAGVEAGDIIEKVNGESLDGLRLPEIQKKVAGPLGSTVKLTVKHLTGEDVELSMKREEILVPTVKGFARDQHNGWDYYVCDNPKIAYVRITQFTSETYEDLKGVLVKLLDQKMGGLVLDLRFNPGGRLDQAVQIIDLLVSEGRILSTKGRARPESVITATAAGTLPNFPMVVLVNEHSASASEIVAGSLMDNHRAVVIGERSYGKGSVQELIPLEGHNGELKMTVAYYYLPSGRLVHRKKDAKDWGVEPQIVVKMTPEQEQALIKQRYEQELFRRPVVKPTSKPSAGTVATTQSTQTIDPQLQAAVNTLIAWVVFDNGKNPPANQPAEHFPLHEVAATQATTQPATQATK